MVATEGPRAVTEAHLRRNKLVSDLYKTALMTKQLKIPLGAFLVPSNILVRFPGPSPSQAREDEGLLRHLLPVQHISREGSVLKTHRNPLQDPPLRIIFLPATQVWAGDPSVTCSGFEAPHFRSNSIASTLPTSSEAPQGEPSCSRSFRKRRFQTGASPAESLRHWKRSWTGAGPIERIGERRIQTSAAAGRGGEEIHGQEDEVNHHQHRAWGGQRGLEGVTPWSKEGRGFKTWCGLD